MIITAYILNHHEPYDGHWPLSERGKIKACGSLAEDSWAWSLKVATSPKSFEAILGRSSHESWWLVHPSFRMNLVSHRLRILEIISLSFFCHFSVIWPCHFFVMFKSYLSFFCHFSVIFLSFLNPTCHLFCHFSAIFLSFVL